MNAIQIGQPLKNILLSEIVHTDDTTEKQIKLSCVESDQETVDEFQDCNNDNEGRLKTGFIEEFLKECHKTLSENDDVDDNDYLSSISESSSKENVIEDRHEKNVIKKTEMKPENTEVSEIDTTFLTNGPDFESLEKRINALWEQIDEVQAQISEEKSFCKEDHYEINQMMNSFMNGNYVKSNNSLNKDTDTMKNKEKHGQNEEFTKSYIEARMEAKLKARKEILKKLVAKQKASEVNVFKKKLQEVEELCNKEMEKVTNIISELNTLKSSNNPNFEGFECSKYNVWREPFKLNNVLKQSNLVTNSNEFDSLLSDDSVVGYLNDESKGIIKKNDNLFSGV